MDFHILYRVGCGNDASGAGAGASALEDWVFYGCMANGGGDRLPLSVAHCIEPEFDAVYVVEDVKVKRWGQRMEKPHMCD